MGGSRKSDTSKASGCGSKIGEIVQKGPVEKHGMVFFKIRRCLGSLLTNADENPVKGVGPLGDSDLLPWFKGSQTKLESPTCKLCMTLFILGGFSSQHASLEAFFEARKSNQELMVEWRAAYQKLISEADDLPMRFGKRVTVCHGAESIAGLL